MANYNKSFNFRNGLQVDNNHLVVNATGLVGIGSTSPTEVLDVIGNAKITGFITANSITTPNLNITGVSTISSAYVNSLNVGVITATNYYGDGSNLTNLPTSQWTNVSTGIAYFSGSVGVATNYPTYYFQVGGNPNTQSGVGINSTGNVKISGIITASSFVGFGSGITLINASNISSGTLSNTIFPSNINISGIITASSISASSISASSISASNINSSGIITASSFVGSLTGTASTANSLPSTANITINSINCGFSTSGISTIYKKLNIGVGTFSDADLNIAKSGTSSIQLISYGSYPSTITLGRNLSSSSFSGQIRFGNTNFSYTYSTEQSLDIINYDTGNINFYLNPGGSGTGTFNWFSPSLSRLMVLTSSGNLGINSFSPSSKLSVVGNAEISGNIQVGGALTVINGFTSNTLSVSGNSILSANVGISTLSPIYSLQVGNNPTLDTGVGISSSGSIIVSGNITAGIITAGNIRVSGVVTASNFSGSGSGLSNVVKSIGTGITGATTITNIVGIGSTDYNNILSPDPNTLFIII
jgi:hypothetical protein